MQSRVSDDYKRGPLILVCSSKFFFDHVHEAADTALGTSEKRFFLFFLANVSSNFFSFFFSPFRLRNARNYTR